MSSGTDSPLSYGVYPDTGYTKICSSCCARWGNSEEMIGKDRTLQFSLCSSCASQVPSLVIGTSRVVKDGTIRPDQRPIFN